LLRIIVQLGTKPQRFLMFFSTHQVFAQGFELDSQGRHRELPEDELWDYT
jgi:hypothetical protein